MNEEAHIHGVVSGLVMLAAIASTWSVYSYYKDEQVAIQYDEAASSLNQTASALVSLRLATPPSIATSTATTTTATSTKEVKKPELQ